MPEGLRRKPSRRWWTSLFPICSTLKTGHRNPSVKVLFQLAQCLDLSLDALVFPDRPECPAIHTDGLTQEEIGALAHLADLMRNRRAP